ncbi:potassium-transporting ATPase subunit KdpA [Nodosilinea sp. E11]|uniref:potassium-transporting ATPase subunit KdpA n=1 Tax=Nodosilinea sp. E11 TaxID=3037479 RepID=UPI0029343550|nr:potassium-transporting ATPase subunit KdpA [Nodosilinea sp. E11]WOD39694.1 potassium-transporting ATPase subunit KdpA [Nodosilinea sp. E11]
MFLSSIFESNGRSMTGGQYIRAVLISNLMMMVLVYATFMLQGVLPLNPTGLPAPSWDLGLHTAISFTTNTNQQHYSGETTYSYFSQVGALGFLMFTSAATGIAVAIAFIRGLTGRPLGNFYTDLIVSITHILLPISIVGAIALLIAGVPETFAAPAQATTLEGATQFIARGPVAHFEIIKELGENGGGFFGINSAHPFENPNNFTNLLETVIMLVIPAGLILTYGHMAGNPKQGWLIFGIDELAHTNVPGSLQEKRYQDVEVILEAGIDVYSTINIQHLESLNDLVHKIAGVVVREQVPDRLLDEADEVVVIDVTPETLQERLQEGKIYAPAKIDQALQHFFQRRNLVALRELALREVADNFANRNMSLAFQPWYPTPQPGKVFPRYRPTWQS